MRCKHASPMLALIASLLGVTVSGGPPSAETNTVRLDRYGDPLPCGVLLRLGTARLYHDGNVNRVAFTPDGKSIVSCGWNGMLRRWDAATGKELHCFRGHQDAVWSFDISKDGKTLASISQDWTVRLWDLQTGKERHKLDTERGGFYDVAFSPDRQILASCGGSIRLWDTKTYRLIREFGDTDTLKCGWMYCLAFSPDGKSLVAGSQDGVIRFWNPANGKLIRQVRAHAKDVRCLYLAFSPNGELLASAGEDGLLSLRKAATGEEIRPLVKGPPSHCSQIAFSPDGKTLAWSWGADSTIHLFETATGKDVRQFKGHRDNVDVVAFSPDGKLLVSGGLDYFVRLWEVNTGKQLLPSETSPSLVGPIFFAEGGRTLVTCDGKQTITCWDSSNGRELRQLTGHADETYLLASLDGHTFLSVDAKGDIRCWDIAKGKETQRFRTNAEGYFSLSPDGKTLAGMVDGQRGGLYDAQTGKEVGRFGAANEVLFLPDGKSLVLRIGKQGPILWDIAKAKQIAWFQGDSHDCRCLAVSPDGKTVASGTDEALVHRWEISTGEQLSSLNGRQKYIDSLAFSPDGRTLASGGDDSSIWLWEMATGCPRAVLRGHQGLVYSLIFSPDGRRLASASTDTTALVWDLTDGNAASQNDLTPKQLDELWSDLAGQDAVKAYQSVWILASDPKASTAFLRKRLRPAPAAEAKRVTQLLADLDSNKFDVRTKAREELEKLGESAVAALREVNAKPPSVEVRLQVKALLEKLKNAKRAPSPERLRVLRAIEVLERIGTAEARSLLKELAGGAEQAQQTLEAKASLQRLAKRSKRSE